ncbi:MAG: DNA polymerase III subunit chi [Granulosicoccus sp.]|nr:DNA polymerase III subunit chi [Granulosicoccus sp.]
MTRVDFYVLSDTETHSRLDLICRLADKAMGHGQRVFIYSRDKALLRQLDNKLWDFRALSFAAHRFVESNSSMLEHDDPIILSSAEPGFDRTVLVNLDDTVPTFFSRFERALEVVNRQPEIQKPGRERYLFYKQRGYPLQHHPV